MKSVFATLALLLCFHQAHAGDFFCNVVTIQADSNEAVTPVVEGLPVGTTDGRSELWMRVRTSNGAISLSPGLHNDLPSAMDKLLYGSVPGGQKHFLVRFLSHYGWLQVSVFQILTDGQSLKLSTKIEKRSDIYNTGARLVLNAYDLGIQCWRD